MALVQHKQTEILFLGLLQYCYMRCILSNCLCRNRTNYFCQASTLSIVIVVVIIAPFLDAK